MKKTILIIGIIFASILVSAQININGSTSNKGIINIQSPLVISSSGANVTSVSSGDNCIFVSPTTGDVIVTFNTSCGTGTSAVDSVASLDNYLIISPTTGDVKAKINGTVFNTTIDQRISLNQNGFGNFFFANFSQSFTNNLTAVLPLENRTRSHITNITGFFFNYNTTTATFTMNLLNNTIAQYGKLIGFNSTQNETYDHLLNQNCQGGLFQNGTLMNGTLVCGAVIAQQNLTNVAFLNNTQTFTKVNTFNQAGLGAWTTFQFSGFSLGEITSALGLFEYHALNSFDFYFTNTGRTAIFEILNTGTIKSVTTEFTVDIPTTKFKVNSTTTTISNNLTLEQNLNVAGRLNNKNITKFIEVDTDGLIKNNSIIYFNNNTQRWTSLGTTPTNGDVLTYCTSGGLTWQSTIATCPI